ncbi:MAG: DoxX family protein [Actinomycetota bacterium]
MTVPAPVGAAAMSRKILDRLEAESRRVMPAIVRITVGLLWLVNVDWKRPPDFGSEMGRGLARFVNHGIEYPVFPPYSWVLENVVRPNIEVFGWVTLVVEATLAALLVFGIFTRAAALMGAGQSAAIALSVMNAPGEWYWSYILMGTVHLAVFASGAGKVWGVDAIIAARRATSSASSGEAVSTLRRSVGRGRTAVFAALGAYGVIVIALQRDHPFLTADYPDTGFALFKGTMALGVVLVAVGCVVALTAGRAGGRIAGSALFVFALAAFVTYRSPINVLSAAPSTAAILVGAGAFVLASAPPRRGRPAA